VLEKEFRSQWDIFIYELLKWDRKKQQSKGPGILGIVEGFGITVEDQLNGTLHAHGLIFIQGEYCIMTSHCLSLNCFMKGWERRDLLF